MYGYHSDVPQCVNGFLEHYNQEEIFKIALGDYPATGEYYLSPFRTDNNAGCVFEWHNEKLFFIDFGDVKTHRDCFNYIQDSYGLTNMKDTLEFITSYFDTNVVAKEKAMNRETILRVKSPSQIFFYARPFTELDRLFWSPYEISRKNLLEDNVFSLSMYKVYSSEKFAIP